MYALLAIQTSSHPTYKITWAHTLLFLHSYDFARMQHELGTSLARNMNHALQEQVPEKYLDYLLTRLTPIDVDPDYSVVDLVRFILDEVKAGRTDALNKEPPEQDVHVLVDQHEFLTINENLLEAV